MSDKIDKLREDMQQLNEDMQNLQNDLQEIRKKMVVPLDKLGIDDIIQQLVGAIGFVFPLLFTEEIWKLSGSISVFRASMLIILTLFVGYLFVGKSKLGHLARQNIIGIPIRLITVFFIAYGTTLLIIYIYGLQAYYHLDLEYYFKALSVFGTFGVIGAIAVDMLG